VSYTRTVVNPSDLDFELDAFLDWRRWLDAVSLGYKNLNSSLRRLK